MNILSTSPKNNVEKLLRKAGFAILGKNQKETIITNVNGRDHLSGLEAEFTVKKENKKYVVIVKGGEVNFDPTDQLLRRRMIECDRAFGLNGVVLVNPEEETVSIVTFKFPRERGLDFYFQFFIGLFIILAVVGIIWLLVEIKLF